MPTITKKIDPICPFNNMPCRRQTCAIFDEHWKVCSLHRDSISGTVRTSVCDAAVEVIRAYRLVEGDDRK